MVLPCEAALDKLERGERLTAEEFVLLRARYAELDEALRLEELSVEALTLQNKELSEENIRDPLTSVLNRRGIEARLGRAHDHASNENYRGDIYLGMIDIKSFNRANNIYGHDAGDEMLRRLARHLERALKMTDHIGRYGGDEFLIIMPRALEFGEERLVESLERRLRAPYRGLVKDIDKRGVVDLNLGLASLDASKNQKASVIAADNALYHSKLFAYRDDARTCVFDPKMDYNEIRFDLESLRSR